MLARTRRGRAIGNGNGNLLALEVPCRREGVNEAVDVPERETGRRKNENRLGCEEREHARPRRTRDKDSGPNGPKLSDGQRRSQASRSENARPPMPVRWSALLGDGPLPEDAETKLPDAGATRMTLKRASPRPGRPARR